MNIPHLTETEMLSRLLFKVFNCICYLAFWVLAHGNDRFPYPFIYLKRYPFRVELPSGGQKKEHPASLFKTYPKIGFRVDSDDILGEHYIQHFKSFEQKGLG